MSAAVQAQAQIADIDLFLKQNEEKDLLRISTAGSVDDGKSTLIGRLLYDSKSVYEDQLSAVQRVSTNETAGVFDLALLTDGLRAEREQGITIDVAYRYFSTPKRKFIIADTPGHEQYTRNMATGASTANLAVILVDARNGVLPQSRRHAFIASLLGIPHIVVAVNKMDLVDFREDVFAEIRSEFTGFAAQLQITDVHFIPLSALHGDNVVENSPRMPWFQGGTLLGYLESVHIASDRNLTEFRFPVQYVVRPNQNFRGYAGQVASGVVKTGDPITVLPSGKTTQVKSIVTYDGELPKAFPPMSVTICLEDEIDISRGDMLVHTLHEPQIARRIDARVVWMNEQRLEPGREYLLKHTTHTVRARVAGLRYRIDINTLEKEPAQRLALNEIGAVVLETHRSLFFDAYKRNRATGAFILIDPITNETMGAGMITGRRPKELAGVLAQTGGISSEERQARIGHRAITIWLEGSYDVAYALERKLFDRGCMVTVLSGEVENGKLPETAVLFNRAGVVAICVAGPEDEAGKQRAREILGEQLIEVSAEAGAEEICRRLEAKLFGSIDH